MKLLTFAVPCYNAAGYMHRCIETLLPAGDDTEIILIDDGSRDNTGAIADGYAARYPDRVRVIHQENGGHGEGVNQGLRHAEGLYYKVVDSDDWLDSGALGEVMRQLRAFSAMPEPVDLFICNYVYEHVTDNTHHVIRYTNVFPEDRIFTWPEMHAFRPDQFLLMHSVFYRTALLRECALVLPKHTFYVDNIFVYQPLPSVKTICYRDLDLYRYFIGREDQSVNEKVMMGRMDQQLRVTRLMIEAHDLTALRETQPRLAKYMFRYLTMMVTICSVFLAMDGSEEALSQRRALWAYLHERDETLCRKIRYASVASLVNLPGRTGRKLGLSAYRVARKIYKFS